MSKQLTEKQKEIIAKLPLSRQKLTERAYAGIASPRQAIKAKCMECVNYEDVVNSVGGCAITRCPLNAYRPFQDSAAEESSDT